MYEYTCLCCFLLQRRNTLAFNQSSAKPSLPITTRFRPCRGHFYVFVRQPFSKQLYKNSIWPCSPRVSHSSVVRASNRYLEGHGFDSRWGLRKFWVFRLAGPYTRGRGRGAWALPEIFRLELISHIRSKITRENMKSDKIWKYVLSVTRGKW